MSAPRRRLQSTSGARAQPVRRHGTRSRRRVGRAVAEGARGRLRQFRQASILAVAMTGLLLLLFAPDEVGLVPEALALPEALGADSVPGDPAPPPDGQRVEDVARVATEEATGALRDMWVTFIGNAPRYAIALGVFLVAWLLARLLRPLLRRALGEWERADALTALTGVGIWLVALGVALSILVGDIRALVGSLGLVGLALSWALQGPIESFTGWLLNSFQGYYRVGDRIAVGEAHGDVYRIDFLTTTVWEYGAPDRSSSMVRAEQATGRLITFPNSEVLNGTVVNYSRDFPFVWDELTVAVANESDIGYAAGVLKRTAGEVLGSYMAEPARRYAEILKRARLEPSVPEAPQVFVAMSDWGANLSVRYLVGAKERRPWKSELSARVLAEFARSEHAGKIIPVYPRQQVQLVRADGAPFEVEGLRQTRES